MIDLKDIKPFAKFLKISTDLLSSYKYGSSLFNKSNEEVYQILEGIPVDMKHYEEFQTRIPLLTDFVIKYFEDSGAIDSVGVQNLKSKTPNQILDVIVEYEIPIDGFDAYCKLQRYPSELVSAPGSTGTQPTLSLSQ